MQSAVGCPPQRGPSATASSLHPPIPPTPRGDHRPGGGVPAPPSVPRIRHHNIIHRDCETNCRTVGAPPEKTSSIDADNNAQTPYQQFVVTIRIMLSWLRRQGAEVPPSNIPGEAAAGEGLAAVAGLHPALCQPRTGQRNWGPVPPNSSTSVQPRINDIKFLLTSSASASAVCENPAALCPSGGSARHRTSAVQQSWPAHVRHRSSKVRQSRV